MPISVQSLAVNEQTFEAEFNDQRFNVTYRPRVFTSKFQRDYDRVLKAKPTDAEDAAWWLSHVVTAWDVLGEDGQPLPLDEEWLGNQDVVDTQFFWSIVTQIHADRRPKAQSSTLLLVGSGQGTGGSLS